MSHKIAHVKGFQGALDFYISQTNAPRMTPKELRLTILREFEENDRRRGTPYLSVTTQANTDQVIEYKQNVTFADGEEPYIPGKVKLSSGVGSLRGSDEYDKPSVSSTNGDFDDSVPDSTTVQESGNSREVSESSLFGSFNDSFEQSFDDDSQVEEYDDDSDDQESDTAEVTEISPSSFMSLFTTRSKSDVSPLEDFTTIVETVTGEDGNAEESHQENLVGAEEKPTRESLQIPKRSSRVKKSSPIHPMMRKKKASSEQKASPEKRVEPKKIIAKPVEQSKTNDAFDQFDSMLQGVSTGRIQRKQPTRPVKEVITEYKTLREFVKNNPGCSVDHAKQYFPEKEIKKQINVGRIYYKNGKLTV